MTSHIRDNLQPFLALLEEMKLLNYGEIDIVDEEGEVWSYKGQLFQGKAYGKGILKDLWERVSSKGTFVNNKRHGLHILSPGDYVCVEEVYLGGQFGKSTVYEDEDEPINCAV